MAAQPSRPTKGRVYFRDIKPYAVVNSLHQLRSGPPAGSSGLTTDELRGLAERMRAYPF